MKPRGRARGIGVLVALCFVNGIVASGCSLMSNPKYDLSNAGCQDAPDIVIKVIEAKLTVAGNLRNGKEIKGSGDSEGYTFVSAELHRNGDKRHRKGDILTLTSKNPDQGDFLAVDTNARDQSSWQSGGFDVRVNGARESRGCTALYQGKTKAQVECERNRATDDFQLPNGERCSDL